MPQSSRSSRYSRVPSGDVTYSHSKTLKIPRESSSPSSWARFSNDTTVLVLSGYSVATAMGEDIGASVSSAHQLAEKWFTPIEEKMYSDFKKGKSPPRVDWRRLSKSLSATTSAQRARWNDLTDALRILYDDRNITKENCKAWTEKYVDVMPLLTACKKVELARQDLKPLRSSSSSSSSSSKSRYDLHEIIACRKIISEIGKQRVRSSTKIKQLNKDIDQREQDTSKRLAKLNMDEPRDKTSAQSKFSYRENYFNKLVKLRIERIEMNAQIQRQNQEISSCELALKERIAILEERMRRYK